MNIKELKELLAEMAVKDLEEGHDIDDHVCSVAIRALDKSFSDVEILKSAFKGKHKSKSKAVQVLMGLPYNPEY